MWMKQKGKEGERWGFALNAEIVGIPSRTAKLDGNQRKGRRRLGK
jgi:hypothetical protein